MVVNKVMLSIIVPVYNHERYIEKALNSILMQKTSFSYEVLVGEDCSTDNTRMILRKIEKNYPKNFKFFYREKNLSNSPIANASDLKLRAQGKYFICLEGDDYWVDEFKIEKQVCFLEKNQDYIAVAHNCVVVGADSCPNGESYPECYDNDYSFEHLKYGVYPGQYATLLMRNIFLDKDIDTRLLFKKLRPGDRILYFLLLCNGKVYCLQEVLTAYRHVVNHGSSYSANFKLDFEKYRNYYEELLTYSKGIGLEEAIECAKCLYYYFLTSALLRGNLSIRDYCQFIRKEGYLITIQRVMPIIIKKMYLKIKYKNRIG